MNTFYHRYIPRKHWFAKFDDKALIVLFAVILADIVFLLLHLGLNFDLFSDRQLHLEVDNGYSEQFQYLKLAVSVGLLLFVFVARRGKVRIMLALLLLFLLLEDILQVHEDFYLIGERFLSLQAIGELTKRGLWELIYGLGVGGALLGLFLLTVIRTADPVLRKRMVLLSILLVFFGVFGVLIDAFHGIFQHAGGTPYLESFLGIVEDWGEMLTISLITAVIIDDLYRTAPTKVLSGGPR